MASPLGASLRFRLRADQEAGLAVAAEAAGVKVPELVRRYIDEGLGIIRRPEQLRPPEVPVKPLVRQVCPPAGKNDHVVMDDDVVGSVTPPPTRWDGRTAQQKRQVRVISPRCQCPAGTPLEGSMCTGCWQVR